MVIAFKDINPQAPHHIVIIPKKHIAGVMDLNEDDQVVVSGMFQAARETARQLGIASSGFRLVYNSGSDAGQVVPHVHMHLLGGRKLHWPPG